VSTGYDPYAAAPASPVGSPAYYPSPEAPLPPPPQLQHQRGAALGHRVNGQPGASYDPFLEQPPVVSPVASPLPQPEQRIEPWQRDVPPRLPGELWPHSGPQRVAPAEQALPWQRAVPGASGFAPAHVAPTWPPPQTPQQSPPVPLQQMHREPLPGPAVQHPMSRLQQGAPERHQAQPAPHFLGRMHRAQPAKAAGQLLPAYAMEPAPLWQQQPPVYSPRGGPLPDAYGAPQLSNPAAERGPPEHVAAPQQRPGLRDVRGGSPLLPQQSWPQGAPHQLQWDPGQVGPRPWGPQPALQQPFPQHQQQRSAPAPLWPPRRGW